jgi:hypothetical protein
MGARILTHDELLAAQEARWPYVDARVRAECVAKLRGAISPADRSLLAGWFRDGSFPPGFHFLTGMMVRNALREVARDDQLPPVRYGAGEDRDDMRNWDDYYMAALRQAVAPREGEA